MKAYDLIKGKVNKVTNTSGIVARIDEMIHFEYIRRRGFERRWYNNNFFDDGFHFRYVSADTGQVIDLSSIKGSSAPKRNIPKASRQLRGVVNLLLAPNYVPVVYPEYVSKDTYEDKETYDLAKKIAKKLAQRHGQWLLEEWDELEIIDKLTDMLLKAGKHGIAYLQVYPDTAKEIIKAMVFDAFDIYIIGDVADIYDASAIIKVRPRLIPDIQADRKFDNEVTKKLNPDNKMASSEVKEAYKRSKFGSWGQRGAPTILEKEAFIKEYLTEELMQELMSKEDTAKLLVGKKVGDMCMRQVFTAGGVLLYDKYVKLDEYPFVDFRYEPGELYQTPYIERFIPSNKSLDIIVNRIERWANTMAGGSWSVRKGENFNLVNAAGGVVYEYDQTPPIQNQVATMPQALFNLIELFESFIEEQGASTSALGKLPQGVKSGVAIESLKATEYDNLTIPSNQLKKTIKRLSQRMLEYGSDNILSPKEVTIMNKGDQESFKVIGERGARIRRDELGEDLDDNIIEIRKDVKVKIEVESGLGFTTQGKKETAQQIIEYMLKLVELKVIPMEAVKHMTRQFLEIYQFGATQEIMEAMDEFMAQNNGQMPQDGEISPEEQRQMEVMKVAVLEAMQTAGEIGPEKEQQMVEAVKVGMMEVFQALQKGGIITNGNQ